MSSRWPFLSAKQASQFIQFGLSGLPAFLFAIGLNVLLNEIAHWPKPISYLLVGWVQMTSGFLMSHFVVFRNEARKPLLQGYLQFALSMGIIRAADWVCYTVAVEVLKVPYVVAQTCTGGLFLLVKFVSARSIFRSKTT